MRRVKGMDDKNKKKGGGIGEEVRVKGTGEVVGEREGERERERERER